VYQGTPPDLYGLGVFQHISMGISMICMAVSIGAIIPSSSVMVAFMFSWIFLMFGNSIPTDLHWMINFTSTVLHYLLPAGIPYDLLSSGKGEIDFDQTMIRWDEILDNLMYGSLVMWLAILYFTKKDLRLREKV
jgi:hypothetical protein